MLDQIMGKNIFISNLTVFKEKVRSMFKTVFGDTEGILHSFNYSKIDIVITSIFVTFFLHITKKLTVKTMCLSRMSATVLVRHIKQIYSDTCVSIIKKIIYCIS